MSTNGAKPHTRFNEKMTLYKTKTVIATTNQFWFVNAENKNVGLRCKHIALYTATHTLEYRM